VPHETGHLTARATTASIGRQVAATTVTVSAIRPARSCAWWQPISTMIDASSPAHLSRIRGVQTVKTDVASQIVKQTSERPLQRPAGISAQALRKLPLTASRS
jgi:hypothetical protein